MIFELFAHYGDAAQSRQFLLSKKAPEHYLRILGPERMSKIRPFRSRAFFDHAAWLNDPAMRAYEFIDGDPDRVLFRGLELRSGDFALMRLNRFGDGALGSFLKEPFALGHAMLFVSRRVKDNNGHIHILPSLVEIFEGGWRSVPLPKTDSNLPT
jgi:hypothetical protein